MACRAREMRTEDKLSGMEGMRFVKVPRRSGTALSIVLRQRIFRRNNQGNRLTCHAHDDKPDY
jgi:hypothetical protein